MDFSNNKLSTIRKHYIETLKGLYSAREGEALLDILIEYYFAYDLTDIITRPDIKLSESEILKLHFAVKELLSNKPVQYIIGETVFLDMRFKVNPNVLIPRPETEELVMIIANNEKDKGLGIIDIGTGSGCIAISLSKILIEASVCGIDAYDDALEIAKHNAELNSAAADFRKIDILNYEKANIQKFDVIVSNPPYVTSTDKFQMKANVLDHEPETALFVPDEDPLLYYKAIVSFAKTNLKDGGRIYVEINESLGDQTAGLFIENGFCNVELLTDLNEKDRFVLATLKRG